MDELSELIGETMLRNLFLLLLIFCLFKNSFAQSTLPCAKGMVPITGFAQSFLTDQPIANAKIKILEGHQVLQTDSAGNFQFCAKPGKQITLVLQKSSFLPWENFKTIQTGTFIVPKNGMVGPLHDITFQVPTMITYHLLKTIIVEKRGIRINPKDCNVVTTITAYHKTLKDDPQGEPGARVQLWHNGKRYLLSTRPYYFGVIAGKTNPFTSKLKKTTLDGGVLIYNLPSSTSEYEITASKKGRHFSRKAFMCKSGAFINISPPDGPMVKQSI